MVLWFSQHTLQALSRLSVCFNPVSGWKCGWWSQPESSRGYQKTTEKVVGTVEHVKLWWSRMEKPLGLLETKQGSWNRATQGAETSGHVGAEFAMDVCIQGWWKKNRGSGTSSQRTRNGIPLVYDHNPRLFFFSNEPSPGGLLVKIRIAHQTSTFPTHWQHVFSGLWMFMVSLISFDMETTDFDMNPSCWQLVIHMYSCGLGAQILHGSSALNLMLPACSSLMGLTPGLIQHNVAKLSRTGASTWASSQTPAMQWKASRLGRNVRGMALTDLENEKGLKDV